MMEKDGARSAGTGDPYGDKTVSEMVKKFQAKFGDKTVSEMMEKLQAAYAGSGLTDVDPERSQTTGANSATTEHSDSRHHNQTQQRQNPHSNGNFKNRQQHQRQSASAIVEPKEKEHETVVLEDSDSPFLPVGNASKAKEAGEEEAEDDDFDVPSDDDDDEKLRTANAVGRLVLHIQRGVRGALGTIDDKFGGYFSTIVGIILYITYFIWAMVYRFGDEGSIRLLWCTILGVVIATRHRLYRVVGSTRLGQWWTRPKPPSLASRLQTLRFFTRWLMYGGIGAFMAWVIVDVATKDPARLRSLPGIVFFMSICLFFSSAPSKVNWHTIYWSLGMQFVLAVLVMRLKGGQEVVLWVQTRLDGFFASSKPAARLIFGDSYQDHYIIFGALPIVFLTNATLSMLYYVGAMQFLVNAIGSAMRFVLGTTAIESTGIAASIFMEGATAMLALRPYLGKLTHSELFALTTACLASIGGAFLAILSVLGIPVEFMLPAMVISAPATFTVCKLVAPETRKPKKLEFGGELPPEMQYSSILEAAQAGALGVISLVANVVVSAFSFFALIEWTNTTFTWFGERVGIEMLTMEKILSYIFYPLSILMGVDLEDCRSVAMLMGLRLSSSSFVALLKMGQLVDNRNQYQQYMQIPNATVTYVGDNIVLDQWNVTLVDGYISRRSEAISTYGLCGFSSILSMFITLSIMATLVPNRRKWLTNMAVPLLIAGNFANFMVGCFAGLLV